MLLRLCACDSIARTSLSLLKTSSTVQSLMFRGATDRRDSHQNLTAAEVTFSAPIRVPAHLARCESFRTKREKA
jgi:hypothetical protein